VKEEHAREYGEERRQGREKTGKREDREERRQGREKTGKREDMHEERAVDCWYTSRRDGPLRRSRGAPLRKGMSSSRVRSTPSATAMVESRRIEFRRSWMSSFFSSSMRMATG